MNIAETYLNYKGLRIISGTKVEDDIRVILPAILMDMAYQTFCSEVRPFLKTGRLKQLKGFWIDNYNLFNKAFFAPFNVDQREVINEEKMEWFTRETENETMMIKVAVMNAVGYLPFERQKVIAALDYCNILCYFASVTHTEVFVRGVTPGGKAVGDHSREIEAVERESRTIARAYAPETLKHPKREDKAVENACLAFVHKLTKLIEKCDGETES